MEHDLIAQVLAIDFRQGRPSTGCIFINFSYPRHPPVTAVWYINRQGDASMNKYLFGTLIFALALGVPLALAQNNQGQQDGVPRLDHVFVIILENHNSFATRGF